MDKIKCCPFNCAGKREDLYVKHIHRDYVHVICDYCGARGELCNNAEEAIKAWNTRPKISLERLEEIIDNWVKTGMGEESPSLAQFLKEAFDV